VLAIQQGRVASGIIRDLYTAAAFAATCSLPTLATDKPTIARESMPRFPLQCRTSQILPQAFRFVTTVFTVSAALQIVDTGTRG
jgi:hypothetical protein